MKKIRAALIAISILALSACNDAVISTADLVLCDQSFRSRMTRSVLGDDGSTSMRVWISEKRFESSDVSGEIEVIEDGDYLYLGQPVYVVIPKIEITKKDLAIGNHVYDFSVPRAENGSKTVRAISESEKIEYGLDENNKIFYISYESGSVRENYGNC